MATPVPLGGTYVIVAHQGDSYSVGSPIELDENHPIEEVELKLAEGVTVTGQALKSDGKPADGIKIELHYSTPYSHGFSSSARTTDGEGRFQFEHVNPDVPGEYWVVALGIAKQHISETKIDPNEPVMIHLKE